MRFHQFIFFALALTVSTTFSAKAQELPGRKAAAAEIAEVRSALAKYEKEDRELGLIKNPDEKQKQYQQEIELVLNTLHQRLGYAYKWWKEVATPVDKTAGVSNICPVHHCAMTATIVPIEYGLLRTWASDPPDWLREKEFPLGRTWYAGGCVSGNFSPTLAKIYVCPECLRAEQLWYRNYAAAQAALTRPNPHP